MPITSISATANSVPSSRRAKACRSTDPYERSEVVEAILHDESLAPSAHDSSEVPVTREGSTAGGS